jgi:hypothetical protein
MCCQLVYFINQSILIVDIFGIRVTITILCDGGFIIAIQISRHV